MIGFFKQMISFLAKGHMRNLFDKVPFENFIPQFNANSCGYNLMNKKDGIILMYTPKENHYFSPKVQMSREFNRDNATQQWFITSTGEFTTEKKIHHE